MHPIASLIKSLVHGCGMQVITVLVTLFASRGRQESQDDDDDDDVCVCVVGKSNKQVLVIGDRRISLVVWFMLVWY